MSDEKKILEISAMIRRSGNTVGRFFTVVGYKRGAVFSALFKPSIYGIKSLLSEVSEKKILLVHFIIDFPDC